MSLMKDYRTKELKWYIWAYMCILLGTSGSSVGGHASSYLFSYFDMLLTSAFFTGAICALTFVFDSLYTAQIKEILLCLGLFSLPGRTIFTRISEGKIKDGRIDIKKAQIRYKIIIDGLPLSRNEKESYENEKWYSLSRQHQEDPMIKSAHRDYLLSRDMFTATMTMLILTGFAMLFKAIHICLLPVVYLIVMLVLTNVASHFKASRFVNSVIVADLNA